MANISAANNEYVKALNYIKELKQISLSTQAYESYIMACNLEAKIFYVDHNYEEAKNILNNARLYLPKIDDLEARKQSSTTINIFRWNIFKYLESNNKSNKDSMLRLSKNIYDEGVLIKNTKIKEQRILIGCIYSASVLIEQRKSNEAKKYIEIARKHVQKADPKQFIIADFYEVLGDYEYKNFFNNPNYLKLALESYKKSLSIAKELDYSHIERKLHPKLAMVYKDLKDLDNENIHLIAGIKKQEEHELSLKKSLNEIKPKLYTNRNKDEIIHNNFYGIILLVVITLIISIFFIKRILVVRHKNEQPIENINQEYIDDSSSDTKNTNLSVEELYSNLSDNLDLLYPNFLQVYPNFIKKLQNINPSLKSSDVEYCAMFMLNFDNKKIARIKNVTLKSVESKKYRIRKKLKIPTEENLNLWLSKL